MAKSTRKSTFEQDSKAVLNTVLTPDAKARVQREKSLTQPQPAPADNGSVFSGGAPSAGADGAGRPGAATKSTGKGKLTLAGLSKRTERFMEEVLQSGQSQRAVTDGLAREVQNLSSSVHGMEAKIQSVLDDPDARQHQLQHLAQIISDMQGQLAGVVQTLSEKPWEAMRANLSDAVQELGSRLHRLERTAESPGTVHVPDDVAVFVDSEPPKPQPTHPEGPQDSAAFWLDKARAYWSGKRFSDPRAAIICLNTALELKPDNAECLNERGLARTEVGALQEALADFTRAIELAPSMSAAYHNRGLLYGRMNAQKQACRDFQRAASLGDDRAWQRACERGYCGGSFLKAFLRGIID